MAPLPVPSLFRLLKKSLTPLAQNIEVTYNNIHTKAHFMGVSKLGTMASFTPLLKTKAGLKKFYYVTRRSDL